jgi:hypothetical protein
MFISSYVVLALLSTADYNTFLGEVALLFDVPDFEDPVGVQCVKTAGLLVDYKVNDVVVLQGRSGAQVDYLQRRGSLCDIVLAQLILTIQKHYLPKGVEVL